MRLSLLSYGFVLWRSLAVALLGRRSVASHSQCQCTQLLMQTRKNPQTSRPVGAPPGNLRPIEARMFASAASGEWLDLGAGPFELADMRAAGTLP